MVAALAVAQAEEWVAAQEEEVTAVSAAGLRDQVALARAAFPAAGRIDPAAEFCPHWHSTTARPPGQLAIPAVQDRMDQMADQTVPVQTAAVAHRAIPIPAMTDPWSLHRIHRFPIALLIFQRMTIRIQAAISAHREVAETLLSYPNQAPRSCWVSQVAWAAPA